MKKILLFALFIYNQLQAQQVSQKIIYPDTSKIISYSGQKTINTSGNGNVIEAMLWAKNAGGAVTQFVKTTATGQQVFYYDSYTPADLNHVLHGQRGTSFILYGFNTSNMVSAIDSVGNVIWSKEYATAGMQYETFKTDALLYGDTLVIAKSVAKNSIVNTDVNLLVVNARNGKIIKQLQMSLPGANEEIIAIKPTNDHGLIILTNYRGGFSDYYKPLIVKLDKSFNIEWTKLFGDQENYAINATDIVSTKDGGFAVCGWHEYYVGRNYKVNGFLLKLDDQGSVLWNKSFHALSGGVEYYSVCETADGKLNGVGTIDRSVTHIPFIAEHTSAGGLLMADTIIVNKNAIVAIDDNFRIVNTTGNTFVTFTQYNTTIGGMNLITGRSDIPSICNFEPASLITSNISFQLINHKTPTIVDVTANARQRDFSFVPDNLSYSTQTLCSNNAISAKPVSTTDVRNFNMIAIPSVIQNNSFNLKLTSNAAGNMNIIIKTENGETIYNQKLYMVKGSTEKTIILSGAYKGFCFLQATLNNNEVEQLKIFKQ